MADTYQRIVISGISRNIARAGIIAVTNLPSVATLGGLYQEYNPATQEWELQFGGADLSIFLAEVRATIVSRLSRNPDLDVQITRAQAKLRTTGDTGR